MTRPLLLTLAALLVVAAPAQADSVVDTHADVVSADGKCSLREAVERNPDCGTGTIRVPGGGGPYLLTGTLVFADGTAPTRVEGTGAVLQATGAPHRMVVVASNRTAFLSGLTIKGGVATGPTFAGGGIHNLGNLTLERVVVSNLFTVARSILFSLRWPGSAPRPLQAAGYHRRIIGREGGSPRRSRPASSNQCEPTATCWVAAWTSRRARCNGLRR